MYLYNMITIFFRAKLLAIKRRVVILLFKEFNPYPKISKNLYLSPSDIIHDNKHFPEKKINKEIVNNNKWKTKAKNILTDLLKINNNLYCKEKFTIDMPIKKGYSRKRIYFEFSKHRHAPVDIVVKNKVNRYKGIILCMQGSNSGAHLSLGEIKMPADIYKVAKGSSLALQAADAGFIAVSYERIGFGERQERKLKKANPPPNIDYSLHSLLIGNTSLGETVSEIMLLVKWLKNKYNMSLWLKGYSEAGTASLFSAAVDTNIDGIMIGGCIGLTDDTLLKRGSSGLNNIPNFMTWFDQDTILSLISPRPCIVVAGINDHIYPYKYAIKTLKIPKIVYKNDNAKNNLVLIKGSKGHTYYPKLAWPKIIQFFK